MLHIHIFLLCHRVSATGRSQAQTSIRAEFPSGKLPITRVRRRISLFRHLITLLVWMRVQSVAGKFAVGQRFLNAILHLFSSFLQLHRKHNFLHHDFGFSRLAFLLS